MEIEAFIGAEVLKFEALELQVEGPFRPSLYQGSFPYTANEMNVNSTIMLDLEHPYNL